MAAPSLIGSTPAGSNATYNTLAASVPVGIQANDVILVVVNARGSSSVTCTATGYTQKLSQARASSSVHYVLYKYADGTETSVPLVFGSTSNHSAIVLVVRGVDQSNPFDVSASNSQSTAAAAHVTPSVTTTVNDTLIIRTATTAINGAFTYSWSSGTVPAEADATTGGTQNTTGVAYATQASPGSSGTDTATMSSNTATYAGSTVAVRPPQVAGNLTNQGAFFSFF